MDRPSFGERWSFYRSRLKGANAWRSSLITTPRPEARAPQSDRADPAIPSSRLKRAPAAGGGHLLLPRSRGSSHLSSGGQQRVENGVTSYRLIRAILG
jgi:hypothetical protein